MPGTIPSCPGRDRAAFSLIELLVVVAVISVLASVTVLVVPGMVEGRGLAGGVSLASSMAHIGRSSALLNNSRARMLFDDDYVAASPDRYRRRVAVVRWVADPDGGPSGWVLSGGPNTLPEGVFFDKESSTSPGTMGFDLGSTTAQNGTSGPQWSYYEFDPAGMLDERRMVALKTGFQEGGEIVERGTTAKRDGFLLQKLGRVTYLPDDYSW